MQGTNKNTKQNSSYSLYLLIQFKIHPWNIYVQDFRNMAEKTKEGSIEKEYA